MATRLYLPSSGTPPLASLPIHSYWGLPAGSDPEIARLPMFTTRQNTALTTNASTWTSTSTNDWCWFQFQSEPVLSSVDVGAFCVVAMCRCHEASGLADTYLEFTLRSVSGDGSTEKEVLVSGSSTSGEFSSTAYTSRASGKAASGATVDAGDRLILEIGVKGFTPSLSEVEMRIGDPDGVTELTSAGQTDDYVPWFNIEQDISFGVVPDVQLTGATTQTKQTVSGTLTLTDVDVRLTGATTQTKQTVSGTLVFPSVFLHEGPTQTKQTVSGTLVFPSVFLHEGPTQTKQVVSGELTFTDVDVRLLQRTYVQGKHVVTGGLSLDDTILLYGAATQRKHRNDGVLFMELTEYGDSPITASVIYELLLDGEEYPLIRGLITRSVVEEKAIVTIPSALVPAVVAAAPSALSINIYRVAVDGSGSDVVQLFTGTIDYSNTQRSHDFGKLHATGPIIYTPRVNRDLNGAPYYVRDTGLNSAVRGPIDSSVVPGDMLKYNGVRQLQVSKVVFNLDSDYSFMEATNGY